MKIFRKTSIGYLKRMYSESLTYIFDKDLWVSTEPETYGKSKVLLRTRTSLRKLGNDMNIFKLPSIEGLRIGYSKSLTYVSAMFKGERLAVVTGENYLLREDLAESADYLSDKELKIFRLPTIDKLEALYHKNKEK